MMKERKGMVTITFEPTRPGEGRRKVLVTVEVEGVKDALEVGVRGMRSAGRVSPSKHLYEGA